MTNHCFDETYNEKKKAAANREKELKQKTDQEKATHFAHKAGDKMYVCHCCGKKGHIAPNCPKKDEIQRKDWHVNKAMVALQEQSEAATEEMN